ncbi:MAG: ATP12 family chaperone protein [Rhodospirillales bacterium]
MAQAPKRFYKRVEVKADANGFGILLDGRPLKTPAKSPFQLPSAALAEAIGGEWDSQDGSIDPTTMPLTALVFTALDRIAPQPTALSEELKRYLGTDLVCYRAERPDDLVAAQVQAWDPLLDWLEERMGVRLAVTSGVLAIDQDAATVARLAELFPLSDPFRLSALSAVTAATGSVVIGLALMLRQLDADRAYQAAFVDELFQAGRWGEDTEAQARRAAIRAELQGAEHLIALLVPH